MSNKFKNNLTVIWISQLIPYIIMTGFVWYSIISNDPESGDHGGLIILSTMILTITLLSVILYRQIESYEDYYIYFFPFNSKQIYSQYGNYILIKRDNYYRLYENKYFLFLSPVSDYGDRIRISRNDIFNIDVIKLKILKLIEKSINRREKRISIDDKNRSTFDQWSGAVDQVSERERSIRSFEVDNMLSTSSDFTLK